MDDAQFQTLLADLLEQSGHPDVANVTVMETPCVKVGHVNGSTTFAKIAHTSSASTPAPKQPSWPGMPPTVAPSTNGRRAA